MSMNDSFEVPVAGASPPQQGDKTPMCGILLPVPDDAPMGTKPEKCGQPAPFVIRVKDRVAFAEVPACGKCKAVHDEKAASMRTGSRKPLRKSA